MKGDDGGLRLGLQGKSSTLIVAVIVNRKDRKVGEKGKIAVSPHYIGIIESKVKKLLTEPRVYLGEYI